MKYPIQVAAAFGIGLIVASGATLAQSYGRGRNVQFVDGATISPTNVTASGTADQFVCTSTTATCEVESAASATTMTSTVPAFDFGPTATPGTNDKLACFSYGPSGSKTRTACVDAEGDINARVFQSTALAAGTGFACTNVGCRLSLGNTGRYLIDDGTNLEFIAPLQATTFEATTASGSSLTGGGASGPLLITSNTPDSHTSTTVGAITLQASQDIDANDQLFLLKDNTGSNIFRVAENGSVYTVNQITSASQIVSELGSFAGGNASTTLGFNSNTTDAQTSGTVPAIRLKATQNITDADLLMSVEDSAGNRRLALTEAGSFDVGSDINDVRDIYVTRYLFSNGETIVNGALRRTSSSVTIADNGAGTPAAHTQAYLSTVASFVRYTCNDANGCDVTMSETAVEHGHVLMFANTSANNVTFADISGVQEMAGGVTATLGQYDTLQLVYTGDRWAELHRSDN
jgi:hypothetical protein